MLVKESEFAAIRGIEKEGGASEYLVINRVVGTATRVQSMEGALETFELISMEAEQYRKYFERGILTELRKR